MDRTTIPTGLKVALVRVVLAGHIDNLAGPKVVPGRVVLVGQKHILVETKAFLEGSSLVD